MQVHACSVLVGRHNVELSAVPPLVQPRLYYARPSWWERVEIRRVLTVPTFPVLLDYTNLVVDKRPVTIARHVATTEFDTMALVRFLHAAVRASSGFNVMTPEGSMWLRGARHAFFCRLPSRRSLWLFILCHWLRF